MTRDEKRMDNQQASRAFELAGVGAILLAAMLLRVFYLDAYLRELPNAIVPLNDARMYWEMGRAVYQKGWLLTGEGPYYQAPLYPYALAALHRLGIHRVEEMLRWQAWAGVATVFLTYLLARRRLPSAWAGGAALLYGFSHYSLFFESKILASALGAFLFLVFAWLYAMWIDWQRWGWLASSAVAFGFSVLCRANLIFILPFLLLHLAAPWKTAFSSRREFQRMVLRILVFLAGTAAVWTPVTVRNYWEGGGWIFLSANSGVTLYMGTNERAQGGLAPVEGLSNDIAQQKQGSIELASRLSGRELSPSEASTFWVRRTVDWIFHNPGRFLVLEAKKFLWAFYAEPPAVNYSAHFEKQWLGWMEALSWITALILFGGLAGLPLVAFSRDRLDSFLAGLIAGYLLLSLVYYASDRFLAAMLPILAIAGASAARRVWEDWQELEWKAKRFRIAMTTLWVVVSAGLVWNPFLAWNAPREVGMGWYNLGVFYNERSQPDEAWRAFDEADRMLSDFPPLLLNLGVAYAQRGDLEISTRLFERVLELDPANEQAKRNLQINRNRVHP